MRWVALLFVGLIFTSSSIAQNVTGRVSSSTIGSQETVAYTLEISDADASDVSSLTPPDAEGLTLVSPNPSRSTNMSITNGQISRSVSYTWHYQPQQEGEARILATNVSIGDQSFTAQPITITVVPQAQRPARQSRRRSPFGGFSLFDDPFTDEPAPEVTQQDIFIRATQSTGEAFLNEQITLEYTLYFRPGTAPRNSRQSDSWDAEGFWREDLELPENQTANLVVENGLQYQTVTIRRVAVFPTRAGELSIDPLNIAAEVRPPNTDPFSSFFSNSYTTIERASPTINIVSKALPSDAPDGFTGAVGQFTLTSELNQTTLEVGEALQLSVTVEGRGNIALVEAPQPDFPGIFEIYDPEVQVSKTTRGNVIGGRKTFTWLLIPRTNGQFNMPPIEFAFFDPSISEYVVRSSNLDPITVTGTTSPLMVTASTASGFPVDDIAVLKRDPQWISVTRSPFYHHLWFYVLFVAPLLGLVATAILGQRMKRIATDTAWARNRKAHPLARKHLKTAKQLLKDGNPDPFYAALEQSILGFLGNRLNIFERGLTRDQLAHLLSELGIGVDQQQELVMFLDTCDASRFAPTPSEQSLMEEHYKKAEQLLSLLGHQIDSAVS